TVVLGRASENGAVVIDHRSVSRRHAVLHTGPTLSLEDLGSANGTSVRERRLAPGERVEIATGEVFELGSVMMVVQRATAASRPRRIWPHGLFEARVEDECARAARVHTTFAVVRLHVSNMGPDVARDVLSRNLRGADEVAEYGPDEYELLLVD